MKTIITSISTFLLLSVSTTLIAQPATNWWNQTVFYEIFVRSFYDSNSNGIGDFNGLTAKLDYLNDGDSTTTSDLGIKGIWLMPMSASPSYHGYDVTDYKSVEPDYGTKADFKNFITQAHNRGIKVIIDFVANHTSSQHPWFVKSAAGDSHFRDFYRWSDTKPTYKGPWGQEVWYAKNSSYYYSIFWTGMPDLNYNYQPVKDSIYSAAKYWLDSMDVDGFRLDAAMYLYENGSSLKNQPETYQFWADFNTYCKSIKPSFMMVGEVWDPSTVIKTYNNKMDFCFEFNLAEAILNSVKAGNVSSLKSAAQYAYNNLQLNQFGTFLTNHDQDRVFDKLAGDPDHMKVAANIYLTLPGNPFLYYGEEIGMNGKGGDENKRLPMQWSNESYAGFSTHAPWRNVAAGYATYNVETMESNESSLLNQYKKLIHLRNRYEAIRTGTYANIGSSDNAVFAFMRQARNQKFLVLINTAETDISALSLTLPTDNFSDKTYDLTNVLNNQPEQMLVAGSSGSGVTLAAYETKILMVNEITSAIDAINQTQLGLYPNPAKDILNIQVSNQSADLNAEVYNAFGELKARYSLKPNQRNEVSTENLSPGIYFIKTGSGKTVKFVKQ